MKDTTKKILADMLADMLGDRPDDQAINLQHKNIIYGVRIAALNAAIAFDGSGTPDEFLSFAKTFENYILGNDKVGTE